MPYPSTIGSFINPTPNNKLSSPSHSSIETAQNTALTEIQTFVGTQSSTVGTLIYDIRSANSNGGGHIQTANKGGTGLTSYTKGDLLIATSASVLSKLAVGTDGQVLSANSNQQAGILWKTPVSGLIVSAYGFSLAASTVAFINIAGNLPGVSTTEAPVQIPMPIAGTFTNFYLNTSSVQGTNAAMTMTVRKNGVDTPLAITIPAGQVPSVMSNTVSSVVVVAGDLIAFKIANSSSITSALVTSFSLVVS